MSYNLSRLDEEAGMCWLRNGLGEMCFLSLDSRTPEKLYPDCGMNLSRNMDYNIELTLPSISLMVSLGFL